MRAIETATGVVRKIVVVADDGRSSRTVTARMASYQRILEIEYCARVLRQNARRDDSGRSGDRREYERCRRIHIADDCSGKRVIETSVACGLAGAWENGRQRDSNGQFLRPLFVGVYFYFDIKSKARSYSPF